MKNGIHKVYNGRFEAILDALVQIIQGFINLIMAPFGYRNSLFFEFAKYKSKRKHGVMGRPGNNKVEF